MEEGKDVPPTQLADSRPKLDDPLRVSIPVNAPVRVAKVSQDQYIRSNAFSPAALSHTRQALPSLLLGGKSVADKVRSSSAATGGDADNASIKTAISDFTVLAFSSKRSGRKDVEGTAYVSLGVIYDNQGNFAQALDSYRAYATICEEVSCPPIFSPSSLLSLFSHSSPSIASCGSLLHPRITLPLRPPCSARRATWPGCRAPATAWAWTSCSWPAPAQTRAGCGPSRAQTRAARCCCRPVRGWG